jgi:transcriptional repressor NrdR
MKCPYCSHPESKVTDSRENTDNNTIRRRRECLTCLKRFTTFETIDVSIQVRKRNGTYQDFRMEKLILGITAACRHTRVSHERVMSLAAEIASIIAERQVKVIDTVEIGELVMEKLKGLDTIAYIRFACVYRRFKDMDELIDAIQTASYDDLSLKKT